MKTREQCTQLGGVCSSTTFCLQQNNVNCVQHEEPMTLRKRNKRRKRCSKVKEATSCKMKLRSHSFVAGNNVYKGQLTSRMQVENKEDLYNKTKARTKEAQCGEKTFDFKLESSDVLVSSGRKTPAVGLESVNTNEILAGKSKPRRKFKQATISEDEDVNQGNLRRSERLKRPSSKVFKETPAKRIRECKPSFNMGKEKVKEFEETPAKRMRECMPPINTCKEKAITSQSSGGSKKETETTHVKDKPNTCIIVRNEMHRKDVKRIIIRHWKTLVAYMDPDPILETMKACSMFLPSKLSDMTNAKSQKNRDLLQFIIQRDSSAYTNLKECLQETNQDLILTLLEEAEVYGNVSEVTEEIKQEMKEWHSPFNKLFRALKATISKLDWKKKKLICYAYVYIGREVLMAVFVKRVEDLRPSDIDPSTWTVDLFLENRKYQIEAIQPNLGRAIMKIIFPRADLRLWDVSLFCQLLINICDVSGPLKKCLEWMYQQKNKISKYNDENFEQKFKILKEYISFFADKAHDVDLTRRIADQLKQLEIGVIPNSNTAIITSAIHRSNDNLKEEIKSQHMNTKCEITKCNEELRKTVEKGSSVLLERMDTIIKNQEQIIQMQEPGCSSAVPVTILKIIVQNVSPETEIVISEMIVKSLRFEGPPKDIVIQEAVEEVRKAYRKKDYTIVQARLGCVELFIQCPSIVSLLTLLRDYLSGDLDAFLEPLQTSARILFGIEELQFETVIYEDHFNSILSLLDVNCQQGYNKNTTYKECHTAFNNKEKDESCREKDCLAQADMNCKKACDKETMYEATSTVINNKETKESSQNRDNLTNEDESCTGVDEETTCEATSTVVNNRVAEVSYRSEDSVIDKNVNSRPRYDQEEQVKETSIANGPDECVGSSGIPSRYGQSKISSQKSDGAIEGTEDTELTDFRQFEMKSNDVYTENPDHGQTNSTNTADVAFVEVINVQGSKIDNLQIPSDGGHDLPEKNSNWKTRLVLLGFNFGNDSEKVKNNIPDTSGHKESLELTEYRLGHSPTSAMSDSGSQNAKPTRLKSCEESRYPVKMNATEVWFRGDNVDMKFGMTIRSKEVPDEDGGILHIHKVHKVSRTGVAFAMHIRDGDDILLIGEDHFAPDLTQAEVIKLLRDIKVDGLSRFSLVLQRCNGKRLSKRTGKKCCLIETSAILASGDLHSDDGHPIAEDVRFYERQNDVTSRSYHRYKISGTQLFLEINDNALVVNAVTGTDADYNKILCKYTKISQAKDGEVTFLAALANEQAKNYICIKNKKIQLQSKPTWFDMRMKSSDIQFQKKKDENVPGTKTGSDDNRRGNYDHVAFYLYAGHLSSFEIKRRGLFPNEIKRTQINNQISLTEKYKSKLDNNLVSVINLLKHCDHTHLQFICDNKLTFSSEPFKSLFKCLVYTITILDQVIILDVTNILAGGYTDSHRLLSVVKANLPRIKDEILQEEVTSFLKGALTYTHMPRQIPKRVLKFTYGIKSNLQFRVGIDAEGKRRQCERGDTCKQRFTKHVEKGQSVNFGERQTPISYSPLNKSQTRMCFHVYASELENPQYTDDKCTFVGKLIVELSNHDDLNRYVKVSLTFKDNEIVVTARDMQTGKKSAVAFDSLG